MNAVGVGLDALHFSGEALGDPRPVVDLAVRVLEPDVSVRVDDAGHAQVLVDALSTALVLCLHPAGDLKAVFLHLAVGKFPEFPALVGLRGLVLSRVKTDVDDGR